MPAQKPRHPFLDHPGPIPFAHRGGAAGLAGENSLEAFRLAVRSFAERALAPRVEELEASETFPLDLFRELGRLGYLGVGYPEEYGGSGGDMVMRCLLIEEIARVNCGFAAALLAHVGLGCIPIFRFGTEEQKRQYLVPAIKGEKLGSFGLSEPNSYQWGSSPYSETMTGLSGKAAWTRSSAAASLSSGPPHEPKYSFISTKSEKRVASSCGVS